MINPKSDKSDACAFNLRHYAEIIRFLKEKNYQFSFFDTVPGAVQKRVYLRHDVDISPKKALAMAKIEGQLGVAATYFVQFSSFFYNPFSKTGLAEIKKIAGLGHRLGLHFDPSVIDSSGNIGETIIKQIDFFKRFVGMDPVVSFHRPAVIGIAQVQDDSNFTNVYRAPFFPTSELITYISDSSGVWKKDCACCLITEGKCQNIHLLIHPIWWIHGTGDPSTTLYDHWKEMARDCDKQAQIEIRTYQPLKNNL